MTVQLTKFWFKVNKSSCNIKHNKNPKHDFNGIHLKTFDRWWFKIRANKYYDKNSKVIK